jgi:dUTP pyrophosphatase
MELINVKRLHPGAIMPKRQTELSSGFDLHVLDVITPAQAQADEPYIKDFKKFVLWPTEQILVRTGLALEMPRGMEAQVRPRSGLALKYGITVLNSPGTVDADYRGDIGIILVNLSASPLVLRRGDRVAQLVFQPVLHDLALREVTELDRTGREERGFGSTG